MTEPEVIDILGAPGDYRNADNEFGAQPAIVFGRGGPAARHYLLWQSDTVEVVIGFASVQGEDRVSNGILCIMRTKSDNPLSNMWWRARQRWRAWLAH
jgi:hypothetical protein